VRRCEEVEAGRLRRILGNAAVHPNTSLPVVESWSVQRVADLLHVSESTVRRLIAAGAFPGAFRVGRKLVRIPITDVDAYQRQRRLLQRTEGRTTHEADVALPFEGTV